MKTKQLLLGCALAAVLTTPAFAKDLSFLLTNQSSAGVVGFYVSNTGSSEWEENLLEGGILAPGYEIDVVIADGLATCQYDIRTEFEGGDSFEDYDLDLCEMGGYAFE